MIDGMIQLYGFNLETMYSMLIILYDTIIILDNLDII